MIQRRKQSAFTLIEVLVTITILGVLAAIALPYLGDYLTRGHLSEAQKNIATLNQAQEAFYLENNEYFAGADTTAVEANSAGLWQAEGTDGANKFNYAVNISGGSYTITATGIAGTTVAGKVVTYP